MFVVQICCWFKLNYFAIAANIGYYFYCTNDNGKSDLNQPEQIYFKMLANTHYIETKFANISELIDIQQRPCNVLSN